MCVPPEPFLSTAYKYIQWLFYIIIPSCMELI